MSISAPAEEQDLRSWTIELPWGSPPLSANGSRGNHFARARTVKLVRGVARGLVMQHKVPPLARAGIELHYVPRDRRRRDPFNLVPTLKAIEDGVVDAGILPDDVPQFSEPTVPVVHDPSGRLGRLYVVVRELPPLPGGGGQVRKRNDLPRGRHVGCPSGKLAHENLRRGAKAQALSLHQVTGDHLRPYRCDSCGQWHIGHLAAPVVRGRTTAAELYGRRAG